MVIFSDACILLFFATLCISDQQKHIFFNLFSNLDKSENRGNVAVLKCTSIIIIIFSQLCLTAWYGICSAGTWKKTCSTLSKQKQNGRNDIMVLGQTQCAGPACWNRLKMLVWPKHNCFQNYLCSFSLSLNIIMSHRHLWK